MTKDLGGAKVYLKREDLNHTGAHKINHAIGEALLAKYLNKTKIIAETGAGQHGVAIATAAAYFGMECDVYMGEVDIEKQHPNVIRMKMLGANVVPVTHGLKTLKEAVDAAFAAYCVGKTIEEVVNFLGTDAKKLCKAVVYQKNMTDEYVVIFVRGDLDINETKLTNYLGEAVHPAVITDDCGLFAGFIGPYNLDREKFTVLFDKSLENTHNLSCGANKFDHHYTGLKISRDVGEVEYIDLAKIKDGGICPKCGKATRVAHKLENGKKVWTGKHEKAVDTKKADKSFF